MEAVLLNYITQLTHEQLDTPLTVDDDLLGSGILDSIGMMKLVSFIETELSMVIPPEDILIENFMTVKHIITYLKTT